MSGTCNDVCITNGPIKRNGASAFNPSNSNTQPQGGTGTKHQVPTGSPIRLAHNLTECGAGVTLTAQFSQSKVQFFK